MPGSLRPSRHLARVLALLGATLALLVAVPVASHPPVAQLELDRQTADVDLLPFTEVLADPDHSLPAGHARGLRADARRRTDRRPV